MTTPRLDRYRHTQALRHFFAETTLSPADFIYPIFVHETLKEKKEIVSLPGIFQNTVVSALEEVRQCETLGIPAVILFGIPSQKDATGTTAYDPNGIVQTTIRAIKSHYPNMIIIADCCLCEYTDHGHCGVLKNDPNTIAFHHEQTLDALGKIAISYAQAGVDIVAPSGMIDGMVQHIRNALDQQHFQQVLILSYAAKFASQFYGPFRDAAGSQDQFKGNRKHHQLAIGQRQEALLEAQLDEAEGADMLMVKPGGLYLDIVRDIRNRSALPLAVYHVSGEYSMLKAAAKAHILDENKALEEVFLCMKRAGAKWIISYAAKSFVSYLNQPSLNHTSTE